MVDRHGPMRTGRFVVEIDDVRVEGWQKVDLPNSTTSESSYREGDEPEWEKKIWGGTSFTDLVMKRGVQPGDTRLFDWREDIRMGKIDEGRKEVSVIVMDEEGEPQIRWNFEGAWIKEYDSPTLDASAVGESTFATETIKVAYDKFYREDE